MKSLIVVGNSCTPAGEQGAGLGQRRARDHPIPLFPPWRRLPGLCLPFEAAAQFEIACIDGNLVARSRPMGRQCLMREPKLSLCVLPRRRTPAAEGGCGGDLRSRSGSSATSSRASG